MTLSVNPLGAPSPGRVVADPRLRETATQLEGMFVRQLFAAMRETVPEPGVTHGGAGEEMFTAMLHEHIADELPSKWNRGLAAEITTALARAAQPSAAQPSAVPPSAVQPPTHSDRSEAK